MPVASGRVRTGATEHAGDLNELDGLLSGFHIESVRG